ncbi:PASTA domain-containing protein [Mucilaginibacter limnophilus]|uniref:hypothetical protein n=1 Tax=Mucilaginibacter limnophilus TaxID=1932778 RepID=UPI0013E28E94|nr:hypothetical protein [Mucilaginibacter limnophilus]
MKKIYTAVAFLIALAATESCCKQQLENNLTGNKVIRQSPHANAKIDKIKS